MATEKETIILDLKVDQGSAITELERTKKSIIGVKEEQQQLTKAYKQGEVTLEEYASESVRLEAILKKNQSQYTNIQKSVTGVKTQMDKLIDSNKKISSEFQNAANNIRVAGVSLGDVTSKIAAFANPATAAVGIVAALGAAYARSTIGAKDLEFASSQLSNAITISTNAFARLISSEEDGEGFFSMVTDQILQKVAPALAFMSKQAAMAEQELEDLGRELINIQGNVSERLGNNQELLAEISEEGTTINRKLEIEQELRDNIRRNTQELLVIKGEELKKAQEILGADLANEEKQRNRNIAAKELDKILANEQKQLAKIDKLVDNIKKSETDRAKAAEFTASELERQARIATVERELRGEGPLSGEEDPFKTAEFKKADATKTGLEKIADYRKTSREREKDAQDKATKEFIEDQETRLLAASAAATALTTLAVTAFGQNSEIAKATGITEAIVNTYTGATLALRSTPPPLSFALAALTIANGLASVAQITRAAGGGDFVTKGPALMMVGDNPGGRERVTVEPLSGKGQTRVNGNRIAMAGGGTLTTGFDDGGIVRNGAVSQMQQALMFTNAIKNLPPSVTSWREFVDINDRMVAKQKVAEA